MNKFLMMKTEMESNGNSLIKAVRLLSVRKILFLLFVFIGSFIGTYAQSGVDPYLGEIRCVPYSFVPTGWAECNGQLLSVSQNNALFALLGTTFGGDGTTTFALPDLRGRVPIGVGNVKDLPEVKLGQQGGSATVTLTTEQLPAHTHDTMVSTSVATTNTPGTLGQPANLGPNPVKVYVEAEQNLTPSTPTTAIGGNQPHNNMMPYLGLKWIIALQGIYPTTSEQGGTGDTEPFIGEIRCVAFNFAPRGWALCNGQLLPISQNQSLFALLGTTYGGNGQSLFALPNLQGRVPVGEGQGPDLPKISLGEQSGSETVTLTTAQLPAHTHATQVSTSEATTNAPGTLGQAADLGPKPVKVYVETQQNLTTGTPTTAIGGSQPHNNRMPYLGMNWIICLSGLFPTRN